MAMPMPRAPGYIQMMKEGTKHYSGLEEAVVRNIEACTEFSKTLRSAYGPRGLNKMVINHIEKLFVTNDAATIISQLDIQHPAAKMMVMASQMQEQEVRFKVCQHVLILFIVGWRRNKLCRPHVWITS